MHTPLTPLGGRLSEVVRTRARVGALRRADWCAGAVVAQLHEDTAYSRHLEHAHTHISYKITAVRMGAQRPLHRARLGRPPSPRAAVASRTVVVVAGLLIKQPRWKLPAVHGAQEALVCPTVVLAERLQRGTAYATSRWTIRRAVRHPRAAKRAFLQGKARSPVGRCGRSLCEAR